MHKELEIKFRERWPEWFRDLYGDPKVTCMDLGFTHDDGWFDLVWGLCEAIEALGPDEDFKVEQVKEKFGGLMFYVSGGNDAIQEAIFAAGPGRSTFVRCAANSVPSGKIAVGSGPCAIIMPPTGRNSFRRVLPITCTYQVRSGRSSIVTRTSKS
jgi:hypothetical protein